MSSFKKDQGKYGEDMACKYLAKLGYEILERNYLIRGGEIDIIALDKDTVVIFEVKFREGDGYGSAVESITSSKLRSLIKTTKVYALEKNIQGLLRIDLIAIDFKNNKPEITHIKNITEGININF